MVICGGLPAAEMPMLTSAVPLSARSTPNSRKRISRATLGQPKMAITSTTLPTCCHSGVLRSLGKT